MMSFDKKTSVYTASHITNQHGFGTSQTGDGRDLKTIKRALAKANAQYLTIVIPEQVHSTNISVIAKEQCSSDVIQIPNTDALITKERGIVLTVVTADCVPVLYSDPFKGIIAISHNGWKGTLNGISKQVIRQMIKMGSRISDIQVALGPCIGSECYIVNKERADMFIHAFGSSAVHDKAGNWYLDLHESNRRVLMQMGLSDNQIDRSKDCTYCKKNNYFSYRREGKINGEMSSYILL